MMSIANLFLFILGLIIGSFLNVVIYRWNTGVSNWQRLNGRSKCLKCNKKLKWFELVPVVSFIIQRGRCRNCHSKISWQYLIVELATGVVFVLVWQLDLSPLLTLIYLIISALLIVIFVYDLRHQIIPDLLVFKFIALAFIVALMQNLLVPNLLAGFGLAAFFLVVVAQLTRSSDGFW